MTAIGPGRISEVDPQQPFTILGSWTYKHRRSAPASWMRMLGPWIDIDPLRTRLLSGTGASPLSLQLPLQLVEEAPLRALGDDLLGGTLDHTRLMQP